MRRVGAVFIVALLLVWIPPGPMFGSAAAQSPTPDQARLRLLDQPLWHEAGDGLDLKLSVDNRGTALLDGFIITIAGHERSSSRSALHEAIEGNAGFTASSFSKFFNEKRVPAGSSHLVRVTEPLSRLSSIAGATDGGVYPVTVSLFTAGGEPLDAFTTPLIYYPTPPEIPLGLSLVIPLNEIPSRSPGGQFAPNALTESWLLEEAVGSEGWLSAEIDALQAALAREKIPQPDPRRRRKGRRPKPKLLRPLHFALAPTPRFIEELADMANGYRREVDGETTTVERSDGRARAATLALDEIRSLLESPHVEAALVPYSFPDLPQIQNGLPVDRGLLAQLSEARLSLQESLGADISARWLFPPAGRLDTATVEDLAAGSESFEHPFLTTESFDDPPEVPPPGCPTPSPSFTCPVRAQTQQGGVLGLATDDGMQDRFTRLAQEGDTRLDLQGLFAETAMIREEVPGVEGRVVQATVPSMWHPDPGIWARLADGLRRAPWLRSLTPDEALNTAVGPGPRTLRSTLDPLDASSDELFTMIEEAQTLVESFSLVRPPAGLTERLRRNLLVSQSRLWSTDLELAGGAEAYALATLEETEDELDKIRIGGIEEIRLTSRRGEIPIEIFNGTEYDVAINIAVRSADLRLDETLPEVLQPGRFRQLTVDVRAGSSGIFPVEVSVETPDGSYIIDEKSITVRSTEFNEIALFITLGALAFLIAFYLARWFRKRGAEEEAVE